MPIRRVVKIVRDQIDSIQKRFGSSSNSKSVPETTETAATAATAAVEQTNHDVIDPSIATVPAE